MIQIQIHKAKGSKYYNCRRSSIMHHSNLSNTSKPIWDFGWETFVNYNERSMYAIIYRAQVKKREFSLLLSTQKSTVDFDAPHYVQYTCSLRRRGINGWWYNYSSRNKRAGLERRHLSYPSLHQSSSGVDSSYFSRELGRMRLANIIRLGISFLCVPSTFCWWTLSEELKSVFATWLPVEWSAGHGIILFLITLVLFGGRVSLIRNMSSYHN